MATYTGTRRTNSRRFLLNAAVAALTVAAVAGAWRLTHNGATRRAVTTAAQEQHAQPQHSVVQAVAVPAPLGRVGGGPALDNVLVLAASAPQATAAEHGIEQADAIRLTQGLAPLNATVVVAAEDQPSWVRQGITEANAIRATLGVPPLAAPGESDASIIADENTLRASLGLAQITLIDLR